jgi:hypothetical protein
MLAAGASFDQVMKADIVGLAAGVSGGAIGGAVVGDVGGNVLLRILGGAISGAASAAIATPLLGGDLGRNIMLGAASGAVTAGVAWAAQNATPVSQRSVAESQGGGGGSGADKNEVVQQALGLQGVKRSFCTVSPATCAKATTQFGG